MDDLFGLVFTVVFIVIVVFLVIAGFGILLAIGAVVGVVWLIVWGIRKMIANAKIRAEQKEQKRLAEWQQQRLLEQRTVREAEQKRLTAAMEQELLMAKLQAEAERQEQEREAAQREEEERQRRQEEEAARNRLETEHRKTTGNATDWSGIIACPTPQEADKLVGQTSSMHSHTGKYIHVIALVGQRGVITKWQVHSAVPATPQVIQLRDGKVMFSGWGYNGQFSAPLPAGRYHLAFVVNQAGQTRDQIDLAFEIVITGKAAATNADEFKQEVNDTTRHFVERAEAVAAAKHTLKETLAGHGNDPDEIDLALGKLEARLRDIDGTP